MRDQRIINTSGDLDCDMSKNPSGAGSSPPHAPRDSGAWGPTDHLQPGAAPSHDPDRLESHGAADPQAPRTRRPPWHHPALVIALLILVFPVGLALLWTKRDWSVKTRGWLTGATALWVAILLVIPSESQQPSETSVDAGQPTVNSSISSAPSTSAPTVTTSPNPTPTVATPTTLSPEQAIAGAKPGTALAMLGTLAVKGRSPKAGYDRDLFGAGWVDTNRNGCDTRNDILHRDLVRTTIKPGTHNCVVLAGDLAPDPFSRTTIHFVRGGENEIDIDHVVALSDAWQKGAAAWPKAKRLAFANDPLNLLAVGYSANRQKGDGDAATWLPPNKAYRCDYVARQVGAKAKYRLWVTTAERTAIARVLATCPTEPAVSGGLPTLSPVGTGTRTATASPRPRTPHSTAAPTAGLDPRFDTCTAAKAAGYGPYTQGSDPEYYWYTDRDHDGVVCE